MFLDYKPTRYEGKGFLRNLNIRTLKEDFVWTREFSSPFEFVENFKEWVEDYNNDYPHSSLNYSTPSEYKKEHLLITNKF